MYQQTSVGGWGTMVDGVFDYKNRDEGDDSCRSNWIMIITMTSCDAWNFLKKKNRDILNLGMKNRSRYWWSEAQWLFQTKPRRWNHSMPFPNQTEFCLEFSGPWQRSSKFPNQSEFGLESASCKIFLSFKNHGNVPSSPNPALLGLPSTVLAAPPAAASQVVRPPLASGRQFLPQEK